MTNRRFDCVLRKNGDRYELDTIRTLPPSFHQTMQEGRVNDNAQTEYFEIVLADDLVKNIPSPATIALGIEGGPPVGARRPQPLVNPIADPIFEAAPALTRDQITAFGRSLHKQVLGPVIAEKMRSWRNPLGPDGVPVDVPDGVIRIDDKSAQMAGGLAEVPWEALCIPQAQGAPFAIDPSLTVTRLIISKNQQPALKPLPSDETLRIFVAIAEPGDGGPLLGQEELDDIFNAVNAVNGRRNIHVTPENDITPAELSKQLGHPKSSPDHHHIVHMICHAEFDGTEGYAILTDDQNRGQIVHSALFANLFAANPPHVVVLNSCRSAQANIGNPASGLATALISVGVPYVVAMQYRITNDAAKLFSEAFYQAIKEGLEVPAAVAMGRRAIYGQGEENAAEFITPVLYTSTSPPRLFEVNETGGVFRGHWQALSIKDKLALVVAIIAAAGGILSAFINQVHPLTGFGLVVFCGLLIGYFSRRLFGYGGRLITGPDGERQISHKRDIISLTIILAFVAVLSVTSFFLFEKSGDPANVQDPPIISSSPESTPEAPITPPTGASGGPVPTTPTGPVTGTEPKLSPGPVTGEQTTPPTASTNPPLTVPSPGEQITSPTGTAGGTLNKSSSEPTDATLTAPLIGFANGTPKTSPTGSASGTLNTSPPRLANETLSTPSTVPADGMPAISTIGSASGTLSTRSNDTTSTTTPVTRAESKFTREDFLTSNSPTGVCWSGSSLPSLQLPYSEGSTICSEWLNPTSGTTESYVYICTRTGTTYGWKRSPTTQCRK